jgi:hypothetical protein
MSGRVVDGVQVRVLCRPLSSSTARREVGRLVECEVVVRKERVSENAAPEKKVAPKPVSLRRLLTLRRITRLGSA